jgi:DNA polymerase-3 subunit alpha
MNIPVLPPDVNFSFEGFGVNKKNSENEVDTIRFGLTTIKNFGESVATSIIEERKANGPFKTLSDFLSRIKDKNLNKKSLESLIKTGALDSLANENDDKDQYRFTLLHNLDKLLTFNKEERTKETDQDSLFGGLSGGNVAIEIDLEKAPHGNSADKLLWEKELLGLYISGHPLESFKERLENKTLNIKKMKETGKEKQPVVFGGIIDEVKTVVTKKGDKMVFLKISDLDDSIEAVAFPKAFEEFQEIIIPESCVVIKGTFSTRNGEKSVLVDKVKLLE